MKFTFAFYLLLCLPLSGCQGQASNPVPATLENVTRGDLFRSMRSVGKMLVVYSSADAEGGEAYRDILQKMSFGRNNPEIIIKDMAEVSAEECRSYPLFLVGNLAASKSNLDLVKLLPAKLRNDGFEFGKQQFAKHHTLMLSFYPNPLNPSLPLTLVTGGEEQNILALLPDLTSFRRWGSWGYQIYENERRIVLGDFSQDSDKRWQVDGKVHFDFSQGQREIATSKHYQFYCYQDSLNNRFNISSISQKCEQSLEIISEFIGQKTDGIKLKYFLYPSAEEKGLITGNTDQAHLAADDLSVHTVVNDIYQNNYIAKENELILNHLLGSPKLQALEKGLSIYFADSWQIKGYQYWASKLYRSGNHVSLKELLNNELFERESNLVMGSLAASWVAFLIESRGKEQLLNDYQNWSPTDNEVAEMEPLWNAYMDRHARALPNEPRKKTVLDNFSQGFNFTHEGYQIYNGYLSKQAAQSLQMLSDKRANTVALVPYSGMRDPKQPTFLSFNRSSGGENDESVIYSAHQAKKLGMTVMLKPHVWIRGDWPGGVSMNSEEDWELFFDYYYRWIRHYALLAEIHEMDLFSVGVEFAQATLSHEDDWRDIIRKVRKLYSGHLTYSANWGDEFENVGFWDELDYIGLNCYYPLTKDADPSDAEMKSNFKKVLKKARQISETYNKPLMFTEIGFRSVDRPWLNPHEEVQDRAFNEEHQARCYKIVFDAIQDQDWIKGIYWWKWPTTLQNISAEDRRFVPYDKTAERVVDEWFEKYSSY